MIVQDCPYSHMPISRYRVYCLEELRGAFDDLTAGQQAAVKQALPYEGADILWSDTDISPSTYNADRHLPYGPAINVYGEGTP